MLKVIHLLFTFLLIAGIQPLRAQESQKLLVSLYNQFGLADETNRTLKVASYNEQLAAKEIQLQKNKLLSSVEASLSFTYNGDSRLADRDFSNGMRTPTPLAIISLWKQRK